ncbi:hypothetical protein [Pseudodesulfovibrio sp. zrk46]|uniref:hypothetical protein n=1 Tax=Pseudodesulfovibrio sp. zrk46 TaxID=2725288 RepID=UPI001448FE5B|nr:hypothetical protein [Pseudodesulfovibrio sp. zrk46]QJB56224.1 hypothetical protein HFN16_07280 [Pseudodesulfovibrio sp. zrk46]
MPIRYDAEKVEDYLLVSSSGSPASAEEMFAYIQQVYAEVLERGLEKFLVDETRVSVHLDFHKAAVASQPVRNSAADRKRVRVAVVCAPHSMQLYRHLQELANSTGLFNSRVFDDIEAAKLWLTYTPSR